MHALTTYLHHFYPIALPFIQWLVVASLCYCTFILIVETSTLHTSQMLKSGLTCLLGAIGLFLSYLILTTPPLLVAKLALIVLLFSGGCFCLICLLNVGRFHRALNSIRQECELMTHVTFLQGEMTRAQLEQISERLRQVSQPQDREIAQTMLKTLSPLVMLFLRKEKSLIQWSLAAANMGKDVLKYFLSPRQQ